MPLEQDTNQGARAIFWGGLVLTLPPLRESHLVTIMSSALTLLLAKEWQHIAVDKTTI